jgi:hypothetical protein
LTTTDPRDPLPIHAIVLREGEARTRAECVCGAWRREADSEDVRLTGQSREEILRGAFEEHVAQVLPTL